MDASHTSTEPQVVRDDAGSQYVITVDGARAGFAEFARDDAHVVFTHTVIDDAFSGQGLGTTLVRAALDDVRAQGLRIVALCPFVAAYLRRHHDYDDILDRPDGR